MVLGAASKAASTASRQAGGTSGQGGANGDSGELTKATLENMDDTGATPITVLFNPTEYTITKSISWKSKPILGGDVPKLEFGSGNAMTLKLDLFYDTYEAEDKDVRKFTDKILALAKISKVTVFACRPCRPRRSRRR